jgi:hypothetical protein
VGILTLVVSERLPFSQMASATLAAVPLWKVIAGPTPANCNRARKGPVFFCALLSLGLVERTARLERDHFT